MGRISEARERKEISKQKYSAIHDAVLDMELNIMYEMDETYKRMARNGCYE